MIGMGSGRPRLWTCLENSHLRGINVYRWRNVDSLWGRPGGVTHESPLASCAAQRQKSSWVSTSQLCNPLAKSGSKARNVLAARDHRQTGAMRLKAAAGSRWAKSQMITWPMPVECRESHRTGARREGVHCKAQLLETLKLT
jgi:hypothetical protein